MQWLVGEQNRSAGDILIGSKGSFSSPHTDKPGKWATVLYVISGRKLVWVADRSLDGHSDKDLSSTMSIVDEAKLRQWHKKHGGVLLEIDAGKGVIIPPDCTHAVLNMEASVSLNVSYIPSWDFRRAAADTINFLKDQHMTELVLGKAFYRRIVRRYNNRLTRAIDVFMILYDHLPDQNGDRDMLRSRVASWLDTLESLASLSHNVVPGATTTRIQGLKDKVQKKADKLETFLQSQ